MAQQNIANSRAPRQFPSESENTARAAFEALVGRRVSDLEWGQARARLMEFASLLRTWERKLLNGASPVPKAA